MKKLEGDKSMIQEPAKEELKVILKEDSFELYEELYYFIRDNYNVECYWDMGGKYGIYLLRFQKSKKTLCTFYIRNGELGIWIIYGKEERELFESKPTLFHEEIIKIYEETHTYHDGKWIMLDLNDRTFINDIKNMLEIKKKPNRKLTMCGYCCDECMAYAPNIKKNDKRDELSRLWKKYYDIETTPDQIYCDGCLCMKKDAKRIDDGCPVRVCVLEKGLQDCSECKNYPCDTFMQRKGLSYEDATMKLKNNFDNKEYHEYLFAFDNKSRLDRKTTRNNSFSL
jgi:hypothetical protein